MGNTSWEIRKDGRSDQKASTDVISGNTREIQACPVFRTRCQKLFNQGKISFNVEHFESLTDVTIDRTDGYVDKGDSYISLYSLDLGRRTGRCEFKIQPKLYERNSKRLMPKVALKEDSCRRCIKRNHPIIVVNRWNPLEYNEETGHPTWLVLSVDDIKTLGMDTQGYSEAIELREYKNMYTGECRKGWRLFEKNILLPKYNNQWTDWITFDPAYNVNIMLQKIWDDLGNQTP